MPKRYLLVPATFGLLFVIALLTPPVDALQRVIRNV